MQIGAGIASAVGRWLQLSPERAKALDTRRRGRRLVGRLQHAGGRGDLRARRNHRRHERRTAGLDCRRVGRVGHRRAIHPRQRAAVSRAAVSPGPSGGAHRLRAARRGRRPRVAAVLQVLAAAFERSSCACPRRRAGFSRRLAVWRSACCSSCRRPIMGVGYEYVDQALNGGLVFKTLLLLCFLKLAATVISYSSGNAGGIFAPSLYIGAMAGGAVGAIVHRVAPFPTGDTGRVRARGHGDALRRHHPRADDVGLHDLRDHAGLSDPRAADGRQPPEFRDLAPLSADAGLSRAPRAGSTCTSRRPPPRPRLAAGRPATS